MVEIAGATERPCTLDDLRAADEAFLSSTIREVQPVAAIDEHIFPDTGPVTRRLTAELSERIQSELPD